ncbi:MAG: class I SAM-dependent methyltransferase family protein [Euryarchaeota archaeon]|nr:class I SAM-dependent methyltransferase family protein [Euryarchaeota archaeon]
MRTISPGVSVKKEVAESVKRKLIEANALNSELRPKAVNDHVIFPIKEESVEFVKRMGLKVVYEEFEYRHKVKTYKEIVEVPDHLRKYLPTSYDQVGDIILIKIPNELREYARNIGEAILKTYKSVKSVYWDLGVKGLYRVHKLIHLAGERRTETIHREYGMRFKVDISKVYVSPRLAEEHKKFSEYVSEGDVVFDMFSGYGPFSIFAARKGAFVYATDINPYAIHYLYESARLNKVQDNVLAFVSDCRKISQSLKADHVVMNFPHHSIDFLEHALKTIRDRGIIHMYVIERDNAIKSTSENIVRRISSAGFKARLLEISCGKPYAPYQSYYGLHIEVSRC